MEVSELSERQAASMDQINQNVSQISAVVASNSAMAEETAAASEELSSQANMVKELVGKFRLRHTDPAAAFNSVQSTYGGSSYSFDADGDKY